MDDQGNDTVTEQRPYQLIRQLKPIVDLQLEIEFVDAGVEDFVLTFDWSTVRTIPPITVA